MTGVQTEMLSTQTPLLQFFILPKICSFPSARGKFSREFPLSLTEVTQDVIFHIHQLNHQLQSVDSLEDRDVCEDGRQEEKGMTEDEMVGWLHRLNGHEFEQTLGDGEGQGSLVCCSSWGCKESDITWQLNNNKLNHSSNKLTLLDIRHFLYLSCSYIPSSKDNAKGKIEIQ